MSFVTLSKEQFEEILPSERTEVINDISQEYIYDIPTSVKNLMVRIYSTVDKSTNQTRDRGEDAIRIIFWDAKNDRPIGKGKKVLRVETNTTIKDRIQKRIETFLKDAPNQVMIDWDYVKAILTSRHINSNFALDMYAQLELCGSLSDKQLAYILGETNPKGYQTFEAKVKQVDPFFYHAYLNEFSDEENEIEEERMAIQEESHEAVAETPNLPEVFSVPSDIRLVPTYEYEDWAYPFDNFNPVQSAVMPHRKKDCNMVIGANTSAGKTICAELIMDHVLKVLKKRVACTFPMKALTQEKYNDWLQRFPDCEIAIMTGDYVLSKEMQEKLNSANIILLTSEMLASRVRKFHSEKNFWLSQVGLLVVDESHILSMDDRGDAVEVGLMQFTQLNNDARILLLSATMPNVGELGEWLSLLNDKHTEIIFSTWRPVHLHMHYEEYDPIMYSSYGQVRENYASTRQVKVDRAVEIAMSKPSEKMMIYVHDKTSGRMIIDQLKRNHNETAVFHNADLDLVDRKEIEDSFKRRDGGLRVMVSTSTTALGCNMPARNVIIVGHHMGLHQVDELVIIQMAGRAGRLGLDDQGHVYLIIPRYSTPHWIDVFANPRPVTSIIKNHEILAFHALAEVATKNVKNSVSFLDWYKRSLAYQQKFELSQLDSDALFDDLKKMEMLNRRSESPQDDSQITGLGLVSAWMYYSPYDIDKWHKNFNLLIRGYEREDGLTMRPEFDDLTLAWALTDIPSNDLGYVPKPISDECADLQWKLRNRNIQCGTTIHCVLAAYKCLKGEDVNGGEINVYIRSIRYDIRRVCQALRMIDHMYARWQRFKTWDTIADRIIYGIPEELCELVRIPGIGAKRAKALWDAEIKSIEDVADDKNKKKLFSVLKVDLGAKVRKEAKRIIEAA